MKTREARRTLAHILLLNLLVAAIKAVYGLWTGSLAVAADAVHSGLDATSNVVGIIALGAAARPADDEHPYGHAKLESVASAFIGLLIGGAALRFGVDAVRSLVSGATAPPVPPGGVPLLVATLVINVFVAAYEHRRGRALDSPILVADAAHTASDVAVTTAVIASQLLSARGLVWADAGAALVVLVLVVRIGVRILRENVGTLIDRAVVDPEEVTRVVRGVEGVRGCHRVRSHGVAPNGLLDLHLLVDGALTVAEAHRLAHRVEAALLDSFPALVDVVTHVEPDGDDPEGIGLTSREARRARRRRGT